MENPHFSHVRSLKTSYEIVVEALANNTFPGIIALKTAMLAACNRGELDIAKRIFQTMHLRKDQQWLQEACSGGHIHVVEWLLCIGLTFDTDCFIFAYWGNHHNILNQIPFETQINALKDKNHLAHGYFGRCNVDTVKHLQSLGLELSLGHFLSACRGGNYEVVEYLLPYFSNVDDFLIEAIYSRSVRTVQLLIPKATNFSLAFDTASRHGRIEMMDLLVNKVDLEKIGETAMRTLNFDAVKYLMKKGVRPTRWNIKMAISSGNTANLRYLLKVVVPYDLCYVYEYPNNEMLEFFLEEGYLKTDNPKYTETFLRLFFFKLLCLRLGIQNDAWKLIRRYIG